MRRLCQQAEIRERLRQPVRLHRIADRVRGQTVMMIASNGLGGMVGNLLAGYAIDLGGVNAMLALCTLCGGLGIAFAAASIRCSTQKT